MASPRVVPPFSVDEQLAIATACAIVGAIVGRAVDSRNTTFDDAVRRAAQSRVGRGTRRLFKPLFVLGLPGAYIPLAYATGLWVQHRRRRGGPAIVGAAWVGWLVHRGVKLVYVRARPGKRRLRVDSYPSGHTLGTTALSLVIGHVLAREGLLPRRRSVTLAVGVSAAMGVSRVVSDDHWFSDVIGGWLFGAAVGGALSALSDMGSDLQV